MHGIGSNMFQGIEQTEDSLYSSKENDESDIESGNYKIYFTSFRLSLSIFNHQNMASRR